MSPRLERVTKDPNSPNDSHGHRMTIIQRLPVFPALLTLLLPATANRPPAAPTAPEADVLLPGMEAGRVHDWVMRLRHDLQIVDVVQRRDDIESRVSMGVTGSVQNEIVVALRDEILEVDEGRPVRFRRTLKDCSGKGEAVINQRNGRGELKLNFYSPLSGSGILFQWIDAENDYSRRYADRDLPEIYLQHLDGDLGLAGTLTREPVEPGTTWELTPEQAVKLLAPGGNMSLWPKGLGDVFRRNVFVGVGGNNAELLDGDVTGVARATYQGRREVDGRSMGVVAFELDLSALTEKTQRYLQAMPKEEKQNPTITESFFLSFHVTGTGELLWDFEEGHAHVYVFEGQQNISGSVGKTAGLLLGGEGFPVAEDMQLEGSLHVRLEFREPNDDEE